MKVGIASQLRTRFKAIKTDCPEECFLLAYIPSNDNRKLESQIHEMLKDFNFRAEWFYYTEKNVQMIANKFSKKIVPFERIAEPEKSYEEIIRESISRMKIHIVEKGEAE